MHTLGTGLTGAVDRSDWCCGPVWPVRAELCNCSVCEEVCMHSCRGSCISSGVACICAGELFVVSSFGLVGFCSLCELVFVSVVSSRCPCLRGPKLAFFKWSCSLPFFWLSIACWSFFVCSFSFPFHFGYQMCVLSMHSSRGYWGPVWFED
jgi:hypothetical protein